MENGPFIDGLPIYQKWWLSMAMLNNQMVYGIIHNTIGIYWDIGVYHYWDIIG